MREALFRSARPPRGHSISAPLRAAGAGNAQARPKLPSIKDKHNFPNRRIPRASFHPPPSARRTHIPIPALPTLPATYPPPAASPPTHPPSLPPPTTSRCEAPPAASTHRPRSRLSPQDTLPPHAPPHSPIPVPQPNPPPAQPPSYSRIRPTAPSPTTVDPAPRPQGPQRPHLPSPPDPITASPRHTCCTAPSSRLRHTLRRYRHPQPRAARLLPPRPHIGPDPASPRKIPCRLTPSAATHNLPPSPDPPPSLRRRAAPRIRPIRQQPRPAPCDRYAREPPDDPAVSRPEPLESRPRRNARKNSASELLVFSQI